MSAITKDIYNVFGSKSFLKVKASGFSIEKALLSFGEFNPETSKLIKNIDFYMDVGKMMVFCQDVLSGKLIKIADKKSKENPKFPPPAFIAQGGTSAAKANRSDGKAEARVLKFSASSTPGFFIFQCESGPGKVSPEGLISLEDPKKPENRIIVRCSADDLKAICLLFQQNYLAFLSGMYARREYDYKA